MNTLLHTLQLTIIIALVGSALLLLVAFFGGYLTLADIWAALYVLRPALLALGLAFIALGRTTEIEDLRAAARFNSVVLASACSILTIWAFRANQHVKGVRVGRIGGAAWTLIVVTGGVAVIESANLLLWSASELVALGVIWLDVVLILQVSVLALALTRERVMATLRVQPNGSTGHPNGTPNPYPDSGYYSRRVAPGKPDPRRYTNPSGNRRTLANTVARPNADAGRRNQSAHAPRQP